MDITTSDVIKALLTALPPTLVALAALIQAIKAHKSVNGRMEELLATTKNEATAVATLAEKSAEHIRKADAAQAILTNIAPTAGPPNAVITKDNGNPYAKS